jgi:hypothetical protein
MVFYLGRAFHSGADPYYSHDSTTRLVRPRRNADRTATRSVPKTHHTHLPVMVSVLPRAQFAFIMRVSEPPLEGEVFAKVQLEGCADVADVVARACTEFPHWGVNAGQVRLFLAAAGGADRPTPAALTAVVADPTTRLSEDWLLTRAGIAPGCWLLARMPAAAPAGARLPASGFPPRPQRTAPPSPRPLTTPTQRNATQARASALTLRLRSQGWKSVSTS